MKSILDQTVLSKAFAAKSTDLPIIRFFLTAPVEILTCSKLGEFGSQSPFENSGIIIDREVITQKYLANFNGKKSILSDVLVEEHMVPENFFVDSKEIPKWQLNKKPKSILRQNKDTGKQYFYKCGGMSFPDPIDRPSRTIITSEGGRSPSRTTHIIATKNGRYRRLMPIELERLNMFPDNHAIEASNAKRGFLMGNALVIGIVEMIGRQLVKEIADAAS